jgi:hypothetical protein
LREGLTFRGGTGSWGFTENSSRVGYILQKQQWDFTVQSRFYGQKEEGFSKSDRCTGSCVIIRHVLHRDLIGAWTISAYYVIIRSGIMVFRGDEALSSRERRALGSRSGACAQELAEKAATHVQHGLPAAIRLLLVPSGYHEIRGLAAAQVVP